jgi:hypothetical protein
MKQKETNRKKQKIKINTKINRKERFINMGRSNMCNKGCCVMGQKKDLTKKEIIGTLEDEPRGIFPLLFAEECLKTFSSTEKFNKNSIVVFDSTGVNMQQRATGEAGSVGVGADDISIKLVKAVGEKPFTEHTYFGAGRNAENITLKNLEILKKVLK